MEKDYDEFINALCEKYEGALYQFAYRCVDDSELARDVVQEVFLTLTIHVAKVYVHPNPQGWLFKSLYHLTAREIAKHYHNDVSLDSQEDIPAIKQEETLDNILPRELTDMERELLILRIEKQWDYAAIAEYKGITVVNCRQRMSRAIRRCRELLSDTDT